MNQELAAHTELAKVISPRELMELTGLSAATIWRLRQRGELPHPVQLSPGRVGWSSATIATWFQSRAAAKG